MEQKNRQVEELNRKLKDLTRQFNEQAKLAALSASSAVPDQADRGIKTAVREQLKVEALGQGAAEAFAQKALRGGPNSSTVPFWICSPTTSPPW